MEEMMVLAYVNTIDYVEILHQLVMQQDFGNAVAAAGTRRSF